jgi:hypothetical protein
MVPKEVSVTVEGAGGHNGALTFCGSQGGHAARFLHQEAASLHSGMGRLALLPKRLTSK